MTTPDEAAALAAVADVLGIVTEADLIRARCPRCRHWLIRQRHLLTADCALCEDIGEPFTYLDLLLMVEYGLSWKAYQVRLERFGPPWHSPKEWGHSQKRQQDWQRRHGTGRRQPTED